MEKSWSLDFTTYFTVVQTKPCATLVFILPTPISDNTEAKKRWSLTKIVVSDVETTFRHAVLSGELQCLPRGDPTNICANTRIRLLANHSFNLTSSAISGCTKLLIFSLMHSADFKPSNLETSVVAIDNPPWLRPTLPACLLIRRFCDRNILT